MNSLFLGTTMETWLRSTGCILLSALVGGAWFGWWLARGARALYAVCGAVLFCLAQVVLSELALGFLGWLTAPWLIALNAVGTAAVCVWGIWPQRVRVAAALRDLRMAWDPRGISLSGWLLILLFLGVTAWNLFWGWFLPPREWDGLAYHLPIAAAFVQAHAVFPIPSPSVWIRYYPINGELLETWTLALVGTDKIVEWAFLPAYLGGVLAVSGLAKAAGARTKAAVFGAAAMAFAPGMLLQQIGTLNDALMASVAAMGFYMVVGADAPQGNRVPLILRALGAGTAAGLLAGIKYTGVIYVGGLAILLIFLEWRASRTRTADGSARIRTRELWLAALLFGGTVFALAGYSYIRNIAVAGNPLAPFQIDVGGITLFPGAKDTADFTESPADVPEEIGFLGRTLYLWFEPYSSVYDQALGGLGPLWIILCVPAIAAFVILSIQRKEVDHLAFAAVVAASFLVTPDNWSARYVFSLLILGGVAVAYVWERLTPRAGRLLVGLTVLLAAFSVFNTLVPFRVGADNVVPLLLERTDATRSSAHFITKPEGNVAYEWVETATLLQPTVIVYGKKVMFPYALCGTDLRNRVIPFPPDSASGWTAAVDQAGMVIVLSYTEQFAFMQNRSDFSEVFRDGEFVVFRRIH